ncbi:MAG TPA: c-type cytochrome [Guyparkeria sp.]|nr:c-type cytochrome [Guyparkeria sp.]
MRPLAATLACALSLGASTTSVLASDLSTPSGEMFSNTCAACHGTFGHFEGDYMPPLAGMDKGRFVESMIAFRNGSRPATIMDRVAKAFTDEEIEAMADFFAAQDKEETP